MQGGAIRNMRDSSVNKRSANTMNNLQDENTPSHGTGSINSDESRGNVFQRLATKSTSLAPNKRLKKAKPTVMNFFEPQFNQNTLSKYISKVNILICHRSH